MKKINNIKINHIKLNHILLKLIFLLALLVSLCACQLEPANAGAIAPQPVSEALANDTSIELNLIAVGDNLIHGPIYRQARERTSDGSFDFRPAYQHILPYLEQADLALINQETPLGGAQLGLSSYPMFNSPQELGEQLIEMGFNMISHANNHVLDAGEKGFFNTIAFWREQKEVLSEQVIMAGIAANSLDDTLQILEVKNSKIALLAYTYGTNGLKLPASSSGIVKYIDDDLMRQELAEARAAADIVIVSIHWGQEYQASANAEQKRIAQLLADNGADLIIGSHPHVLQGVEMLTPAENPERQVPVFYSLGNFISAQNRPDTMLGGMVKIKMSYDLKSHALSFTELGVVPLVTDYTGSYKNIAVYPLSEYTAEQARAHGVRRAYGNFSLEYLQKLFAERIPAEFQILQP